MRGATPAPGENGFARALRAVRTEGVSVSKHRFGWPDLLLPVGILASVTGHFYIAMWLLAVYALLYRWATREQRQK